MPLDKKYITVSALNNYLKRKIDVDMQLQHVFIKGEISNFKRNMSSGHLYFTLKDGKSHISAIMFKGFAEQLNFDVRTGSFGIVVTHLFANVIFKASVPLCRMMMYWWFASPMRCMKSLPSSAQSASVKYSCTSSYRLF